MNGLVRQEAFPFGAPLVVCSICGRELSAETSVERGIGPVCAAKHGAGGEDMFRAAYKIESDKPGEPLVIRDLGQGKSVTNDAEQVVADLFAGGLLAGGRRLLYFDSQGQLDELIHKNGRFVGFAPGPGRGDCDRTQLP